MKMLLQRSPQEMTVELDLSGSEIDIGSRVGVG